VIDRDHRIRAYLRAIAALALECADRPVLWPPFLRVLAMIPGTIGELMLRDGRLGPQQFAMLEDHACHDHVALIAFEHDEAFLLVRDRFK
jgi:hypothetical protein